jgi:hypothetical protein
MTIALGKVGKGQSSGASSITANWTGGGSSSSGSLLIALLAAQDQSSISPTTPSGWTLRASNVDTHGNIFVYDKLAAGSISGLTISLGVSSDAACLDILEFTGVSAADQLSSVATGNSTTETTNTITTTNANDVLIGLFMARKGSVATLTLSTPAAGYTQTQTDNETVGGSTVCTTYSTYKIVSSTQTSVSTTCAVNTASNYQCFIYSYTAAASFDPSADNAFTERHTQTPMRSWLANRQRMSVVQMAQSNVIEGFFFASLPFDVSTAGWMDQNFVRPSNILWSPRRLAGGNSLREYPESQDIAGVISPGDWSGPFQLPIALQRAPRRGSETEIPLPVTQGDISAIVGWQSQWHRPAAKKVPRVQEVYAIPIIQAPDTSGTFLLDQNPFHRVRYMARLPANDQWVTAFQQVTIPGPEAIVAISVQSPSPLPIARQRLSGVQSQPDSILVPEIPGPDVTVAFSVQSPSPLSMARQRIGSQHSEPVNLAIQAIDYVPALFVQSDRPLVNARINLPAMKDIPPGFPILVQPAGIALDWNVDQQAPIRRTPRAIPPAEDQAQYFATLTPDVLHSWDVPTNQPFRRPLSPSRAQGEDARLTLVVSAAESFAWNVENPSPVRRPFMPPNAQAFVGSPFFDAGGIVIVAGPFRCIAGQIYFAGAVTGDVVAG